MGKTKGYKNMHKVIERKKSQKEEKIRKELEEEEKIISKNWEDSETAKKNERKNLKLQKEIEKAQRREENQKLYEESMNI